MSWIAAMSIATATHFYIKSKVKYILPCSVCRTQRRTVGSVEM